MLRAEGILTTTSCRFSYKPAQVESLSWYLEFARALGSVALAVNTETVAPLFLAQIMFMLFVCTGIVGSVVALWINSGSAVVAFALLTYCGSVVIHPCKCTSSNKQEAVSWIHFSVYTGMTIFAADQLPKVSSQERSTLFLYAFGRCVALCVLRPCSLVIHVHYLAAYTLGRPLLQPWHPPYRAIWGLL
jgi:hypothetical protein